MHHLNTWDLEIVDSVSFYGIRNSWIMPRYAAERKSGMVDSHPPGVFCAVCGFASVLFTKAFFSWYTMNLLWLILVVCSFHVSDDLCYVATFFFNLVCWFTVDVF